MRKLNVIKVDSIESSAPQISYAPREMAEDAEMVTKEESLTKKAVSTGTCCKMLGV